METLIHADDHVLGIHREISKDEWLTIHDNIALQYKADEKIREGFFGIAKLRRELFSQATGDVLDVACGYGSNFSYVPMDSHIVGTDFSGVMLNLARDKARHLGRQVDLYEGEAESLDFPDRSFDTVISALATCSFVNPIAALREMKRVCKPNGKILLLEHGRSSWGWIGNYQDRSVKSMVEYGGCRWNQEPQELVKAAGLNIISTRRSLVGVFHLIQAVP